MSLKERLQVVFGEDDERINGMLEAFKIIKVFKEEDLKYLDEDILKEAEFFKTIEIRKLLGDIRGWLPKLFSDI